MTKTPSAVETLRDGETFGGWDADALPPWLQRQLAPHVASFRARFLADLLASLRLASPLSNTQGSGEWETCAAPIALHEAARFRKRPVVIEARLLPALFDIDGRMALEEWMDSNSIKGRWSGDGLLISTLEGEMRADAGDWIIRGIQGEFYPCKPEIFAATYEAVS